MINAGSPGHDSADSLGRFYAEMWMFEPDYVLVYHCWNDIKYFPRLTRERGLLRLRRPQVAQGGQYGALVANPFIYDFGPVDRWLGHSQLYARVRDRYLQRKLGAVGTEGVVDEAARLGDDFSLLGPKQLELNLRLLVTAAQTWVRSLCSRQRGASLSPPRLPRSGRRSPTSSWGSSTRRSCAPSKPATMP